MTPGNAPRILTTTVARMLLDEHYHDFAKLTLAIANALAAQMGDLSCACRLTSLSFPPN